MQCQTHLWMQGIRHNLERFVVHWKPISSRHLILSGDKLRSGLNPFWIILYNHLSFLHHNPNDTLSTYVAGTLQCPNISLNSMSSRQRFSNATLDASEHLQFKPISSSRCIFSGERLYPGFFPYWILLYASLKLLTHFPIPGLSTYCTGTLQCPNSSLNNVNSRQRCSNDTNLRQRFFPWFVKACHWKPIRSRSSILSTEKSRPVCLFFFIALYVYLIL